MSVRAMCCVMAIPMCQPKSYARTKNRILSDLKNSAKFILKNQMLWILVLVFACVTSLSEQDDFTGLLGLELGVSMGAIGIMFAVSRVAEICGAMAAHWIVDVRKSVTYGMVVLTVALFAAIMFSGVRTIWPILFLGYFTYAIARVQLNTAIQNMIPSARRSMVLSFTDILCQITVILFYGLITVGAVLGGYKTGFMILGICVMIVGMGALAADQKQAH